MGDVVPFPTKDTPDPDPKRVPWYCPCTFRPCSRHDAACPDCGRTYEEGFPAVKAGRSWIPSPEMTRAIAQRVHGTQRARLTSTVLVALAAFAAGYAHHTHTDDE